MRADRDAPDLDALRQLDEDERFLWAVLPHAARSFSPCIVALPGRLALPAALGYLYCRVLDTYEDLIEDPIDRDDALSALPERLDAIRGGAEIDGYQTRSYACRDQRDEAHAMLAEEAGRLDDLFREQEAPVQEILSDLVRDMAEGMRWAGRIFQEQGGALRDGEQVRRYCVAVLGNPIRFAARLFSWGMGRPIALNEDVEASSMDVGEFLQLANITRDIEKDLARGVSYHPALSGFVENAGGSSQEEMVVGVRTALMDRALALAPAYLELVRGLRLGAGWKSASALLMLRFTESYYLSCASRVGIRVDPRPGPGRLVLGVLPALCSGAWTRRQMRESLGALAGLRGDLPAQASSMYLS